MRTRLTLGLAALLTVSAATSGTAVEPYPWDLETGREVVIIGTGGALLVTGHLLDAGDHPFTPAELAAMDRSQVWAFDRGATRRWSPTAKRWSDRLVGVAMVAPVGLIVAEPGRQQAGRLSLIYTETMLLNMGATALIKSLVARPRPYLYNDDPRIPPTLAAEATSGRSFLSSHTSNAFAAMVFFAGSYEKLYPESGSSGWVWGGCMAVAGTTGLLRYLAGRHYPTDILAGAVLGATVGWLVPYLHEVDSAAEGGSPAKVQLAWGFGF